MTLADGCEESVMKRTTLVANTSTMHVPSRSYSGLKIVCSAKAESVESGEKTSNMNILAQEQSAHPSLSCNVVLCSGHEASTDEVTQEGKSFPTDECWIQKLSSCKWDRRAYSGLKIVCSTKAESVESVEKTSNMNILAQEQSAHPSLSCNVVLCSGHEASTDEVTQEGKSFPTDECPLNGERNFEEAMEFDPIKHHNFFRPWVNGNVAATGVSNNDGSSSSSGGFSLCSWQLTLDALDGF
nr:zinc finger, C3HC [Tanacetum cinerariifolium]